MQLISNKTWMKIHLYLSLFFLPMALIYAVTGAFYIFGFKVNAGASVVSMKLNENINKENARDVMLKLIKENNLKIPDNTELRFNKNTYVLGNIKNAYFIRVIDNKAEFLAYDRSIYGVLLLLHKAHGGVWFNVLAVGFAVALVIFYISGLFLTAFCKRDKKGALISTILGIVITALCVYFSI
ncbi:PepSY-associated TM helix domain-containing protein [Campylobacter sp. Cr9]|uniref:PepSY-associated TM helix domain-containing protein n=1 Tax=Campylobacter sp. Cr9 TaxID=2735728 RepID=UPI0030147066|nr:PepSY-associated TM helix domain-containing protein [Campylobacter sp. Cr9]